MPPNSLGGPRCWQALTSGSAGSYLLSPRGVGMGGGLPRLAPLRCFWGWLGCGLLPHRFPGHCCPGHVSCGGLRPAPPSLVRSLPLARLPLCPWPCDGGQHHGGTQPPRKISFWTALQHSPQVFTSTCVHIHMLPICIMREFCAISTLPSRNIEAPPVTVKRTCHGSMYCKSCCVQGVHC